MNEKWLEWAIDFSVEKVKDLFCNEIGYQTQKLDTRAAILQVCKGVKRRLFRLLVSMKLE